MLRFFIFLFPLFFIENQFSTFVLEYSYCRLLGLHK